MSAASGPHFGIDWVMELLVLTVLVGWGVLSFLKGNTKRGAETVPHAEGVLAVGMQSSLLELWKAFWLDLKQVATKRYGDKTTLEKAYGAVILLLVAGAFPAMPYDYYLPMRVGVSIALFFFFLAAYEKRPRHGAWFAAIVGLIVLYNPISPVHIGSQITWTLVNALTIYALYRARQSLDVPNENAEPTHPDSEGKEAGDPWAVAPNTDTDSRE